MRWRQWAALAVLLTLAAAAGPEDVPLGEAGRLSASIHSRYENQDQVDSNQWNERRWKQAVRKAADPLLSDHLRRW